MIHLSPLSIQKASDPANPLAVNLQKLRREVISRGVIGCLWSFVLPKHRLQVIVWTECHEADLSTNTLSLLMLLKAYKKSDSTALYQSGHSRNCLLVDSLPSAECFACAAAVLQKNTPQHLVSSGSPCWL